MPRRGGRAPLCVTSEPPSPHLLLPRTVLATFFGPMEFWMEEMVDSTSSRSLSAIEEAVCKGEWPLMKRVGLVLGLGAFG